MRKKPLLVICLSILGLAILFSTAFAAPRKYDFSPRPDGFGFHNYGGGFPEGDLTIDDVRAIFGDQVCASVKDNFCTPTPDALLWIDTMNGYMLDGHCVGFTVASYRFFQKQLLQSSFEPKKSSTFELEQTDGIMRTIAKNYVYQMFEEVYKATVDGSPKSVLEKLIKLNAPADIGIFSQSNIGHSVYAYAVEDKGNEIYWIKVYDSNAPGTDVYIEVNTKANTWKYYPPESAPSSNPDEWQGDKKSNSLIFTPLSAYDLPPICPFCRSDGNGSVPSKDALASLSSPAGLSLMNYVTLTGDDANLQLTNMLGQKLGRFEGGIVNEISGAYFIRLLGGLASPGILLSLPPDENYTLQVNNVAGQNASNVDIRSLGNGFFFSVDGLNINPPQQETISISNSSHTISFSAGSEQHPTIKLAFSMGGVTYMVMIGNADMTRGNALTLGIDPQTGKLSLSISGLQDDTISLAFARIEGDTIQVFANNDVQLGVNGAGSITINEWDGQNVLSLEVDINNDGIVDQTDQLIDQGLGTLLEEGQSSSEIISEFGEFSPYMNETENQEFVDNLVDIGLTGREMGKVFYKFNEFGMNAQDLSRFILDHLTSLYDIAGFLYELNLSPDALNQLLNLLPSDWRTYLLGQIAMFDKLTGALFEGEFQGYSGTDLYNFIRDNLFNPVITLPPPGPFPTIPPSIVVPTWVVPPEPPLLPINGTTPF